MTAERPGSSGADRPGTLLDWRFLLPDATLGRISVLGTPPASRRLMLEALAREAEVASHPIPGSRLDGAVVFGLDPDELRRARAAIADDGWVYVETAPRRRERRPAGIRRTLERAGFSGVRLHWHWPSFAAADEILPLEAPAGLAGAFTRRRRSGLRAVFYRTMAAVGRTGMLPLFAPHVSAVATAGAPRPSLVASGLAEHGAVLGRGDRQPERGTDISYLTPRYGTSRNVIALVRTGGRPPIVAVAKVPRDGDMSSLRREAAALRLLERHAPSVEHVPRVLGIVEAPGRGMLLETAVPGRVIDRRDLISRREEWVERVAAWTAALTPLPTSVAAPPLGAGIREAIATLERHAIGEPELVGSVARCRALLTPLMDADLPASLEHGDLAVPNLLVTRTGSLGVVDWELAGPSRFPLHDLAFFLTHLAWELRVDSPASRLGSVRDVLLERGGWGSRRLQRAGSTLGMDAGLMHLALLASWTRTAAQTAERASWSGSRETGAAPGRIGSIMELRAVAVWQMGVAHLDRRAA